ncbi:MAG: glycosyltransferase family 1 protein, partial [Candidatus Altiarchaeales archaeon]
KELSKKMGKNGRKVVIERYSWESTAIKTIEVLEKLLRGD